MALEDGPQRITHRGEVVVVLAEKDYLRLTGQKQTFFDFLTQGPSMEAVSLERDKSLPRLVSHPWETV